jgi:hypothetical protein
MDDSAAKPAAPKACFRIDGRAVRPERRADPLTADDIDRQRARAIASAERAADAASQAAEVSARDADIHERLAEMLAKHHPDRARKHWDRAARSRQKAQLQLIFADAERFRVYQYRDI